jgi:hypothetical protein
MFAFYLPSRSTENRWTKNSKPSFRLSFVRRYDISRTATKIQNRMPAKKFLFTQRSDPAQQPQQPPSPEEMQQIYAAFNAWMEKFKANLSDLGGKLEPTGKTFSRSGITDGPFPEAKEVIGGFMIVTADSYEEALEVAKAFPSAMCPGSSIEVREISTQF